MKQSRAYAAEFLGTLLLALLVRLSLQGFPLPTAVVAGLTLGLLVYAFGSVSGAHVNPAVTLGMAFIRKISPLDAAMYIVCQVLGGFAALLVAGVLVGPTIPLVVNYDLVTAIAEALGAGVLVLGVSSVVLGATPKDAAGLTIGTSLTLGALLASVQGNGVVNPAVAIGIGSVSLPYILGPLVGGVLAAWVYRAMVK